MHHVFVAACVLGALSFIVHAAFAPFYETGVFAFFTPAFFAAVALFFAAAAFRVGWSWKWLFAWSWAYVLLCAIFPPMPAHFADLTAQARVLVSVEVVACLIVFACMRSTRVRAWFRRGTSS